MTDNNKLFPKIKKEIKAFLNSEEGNVNKKDIVKAGIMLLIIGAAVGGSMAPKKGEAGIHCQAPHTQYNDHGAHGAHGSHGNSSRYWENVWGDGGPSLWPDSWSRGAWTNGYWTNADWVNSWEDIPW